MSKALSVTTAASGRQQIFDFLYKWGMLLTVVALVAVFVLPVLWRMPETAPRLLRRS